MDMYHINSSVVRVSTLGVGGSVFESGPHHTKAVKMILAAPLLIAPIKRGCARKIE